MADGNLTFEEFWRLTEQERCERYKDLSNHDKFRVRITMPMGASDPPCNNCTHYLGFNKCDAFPDGITGKHILAVMSDPDASCGRLSFSQK